MERAARSRPNGVRGATAVLICLLAACGGQEKACDPGTLYTPVPTDCATLSTRMDWTVGFSSQKIDLFVDQSKQVSIWPLEIHDCRDLVARVTWEVADEGVAGVLPDPSRSALQAWVTGRSPGTTRVTANIRFADGTERQTAPTAVRTTLPESPAPGSLILAEGVVEIAEGEAARTPSHFATFRVPQTGRVDMTLDWDSPLLTAYLVLFSGPCSSVPCPGSLVPLQESSGVKPVQRSTSSLQPGEYTLRLDYGGAAAVVLRYEVRFTPAS